jgi:hypothetical protein
MARNANTADSLVFAGDPSSHPLGEYGAIGHRRRPRGGSLRSGPNRQARPG